MLLPGEASPILMNRWEVSRCHST